jgi:hypothetical protein
LDLEAHDGFIDGADLLDIEGAVGEALAGEVEEEVEDAVEGAVAEERERRGCFGVSEVGVSVRGGD